MKTYNPIPLSIDKNFLCCAAADLGKWSRKNLPESKGLTEFVTGHICKDISLTRSDCTFSKDYLSVIHYPSATTLLIFGLQGYSRFGFSDQALNHTVRPGDVWLINTNSEKIFRSTPADIQTKMAVIRYSTRRIGQAFNESDSMEQCSSDAQILRLGHQESVDFWLSDLVNNPLASATDRLLAEAQALELIARWMGPSIPASTSNTAGISEPERCRLQHIVERLTSDLAHSPSLDELADLAQMSHTKLNRYFKKTYGSTVFSWLRDYRLERARLYLKDNKRSITHIAFQCGFSSASHFAQAFKKRYACSPAEFRQQ